MNRPEVTEEPRFRFHILGLPYDRIESQRQNDLRYRTHRIHSHMNVGPLLTALLVVILILSLPSDGGGGALLPAVIIFKNPPWPAAPQSPKAIKITPPSRQKYAPIPQHCPETGKTVCVNVHSYPEEQLFEMVRQTRFRGFNFSSVFFDDRDGFDEPHLQTWAPQVPAPPPPIPPLAHPETPPTYSVATLLLLQDEPHYSYGKAHAAAVSHAAHPNPWWDIKHYPKTLSRRKRTTENSVEPACETRHLYISPKAALSDKNQWKYIVNVQERDPRIRQIVRAEICRSVDEACSSTISLPFGYTSVCKQKYLKKKLLSLDIDGRGLSEENFFVPSCCVCELVRSTK
ncbi:uncharacterized protein LOC111263248 isoform X2 [Varroa jacobsoni]|uniref:Spaetzle domain-containing protein n=1 Tax=Varroa destructor TaxID=109461 RepID=A0A7M7KAL8_VARDE|nr:uncharacterized protein LOC111251562 isoform X2 [Varroa destructor]XP_022693911.1 uncharacterized protein LOC111263248 isoform X2 [Varroa jacobsoni]